MNHHHRQEATWWQKRRKSHRHTGIQSCYRWWCERWTWTWNEMRLHLKQCKQVEFITSKLIRNSLNSVLVMHSALFLGEARKSEWKTKSSANIPQNQHKSLMWPHASRVQTHTGTQREREGRVCDTPEYGVRRQSIYAHRTTHRIYSWRKTVKNLFAKSFEFESVRHFWHILWGRLIHANTRINIYTTLRL